MRPLRICGPAPKVHAPPTAACLSVSKPTRSLPRCAPCTALLLLPPAQSAAGDVLPFDESDLRRAREVMEEMKEQLSTTSRAVRGGWLG